VARYSYTAHAPEGNISLDGYPAVRAWLARIEALPDFVPMARSPVGLAA
jgi:glutathione S-transferase